MFYIYFLISEDKSKTYVGFTEHVYDRMELYHRKGKVRSTRSFGNFLVHIIDTASNSIEARRLEKYWKSKAGRNRLKKFFRIKYGPIV